MSAATDPAAARRLALVAVGGAAAIAAVAEMANNRPPRLRIAVGAVTAGTLLAVMAEASPRLASAFAALILATAVFGVGGDAWRGINRYLTGGTPA